MRRPHDFSRESCWSRERSLSSEYSPSRKPPKNHVRISSRADEGDIVGTHFIKADPQTGSMRLGVGVQRVKGGRGIPVHMHEKEDEVLQGSGTSSPSVFPPGTIRSPLMTRQRSTASLRRRSCRYCASSEKNPTRDGLRETPRRVVRALREMTAGYRESPSEILSRTFEDGTDELVVLRGIEFYSIPAKSRRSGTCQALLSESASSRAWSIATLGGCRFRSASRGRLPAQYREQLHARGTAVLVRAHHLCMGCRGVRLPGTELVTSAMRGTLRENAAREEFLRLCGIGM